LNDHEREFRLEEFRSLRAEIELIYDLSERAERNALTLIIVIYGFVFGGSDLLPTYGFSSLLFAPPVIAVFLVSRKMGYAEGMIQLGIYIENEVESRFIEEGGGWEKYRRVSRSKARPFLFASFFWLSVIVATTVVAVIVNFL
jgi:ABC-type maltose transport system permease subunit